LTLTALTVSYGLGVGLLATATVSRGAWSLLYLVCVAACFAIPRFFHSKASAMTWLIAAFYAALFAAMFYGANAGLDALHGSSRNATRVADELGGLELWFVLCPGAFSVSLGTALRLWLKPRDSFNAQH
jgi:hypothetical protein